MKWLSVLLAFTLFLPLLAWDQQDYEIFDLVSALESAEGKGTTFYTFLNLTKGASLKDINTAYKKRSLQLHPDKNPDVPHQKAQERFARLGVIKDILKDSEKRKRYDYFHDAGVPTWRGTGYYYSRFRPGLRSVLLFLAFLTNGIHYLILHLNRMQDLKRIDRFRQSARMVAWGPRLKPQEGRKIVKVPLGGNMRSFEDSDEDSDATPRRRGPPPANYLRMAVEGSSVWILTDDGDSIVLDETSASSPSWRRTWIPSLFRVLVGKLFTKKVEGETEDGVSEEEEEGVALKLGEEVEGEEGEGEKKKVIGVAGRAGGRRRKVVKPRK
ncbi:DnaJ-domain-containing protein [Atractiella rhizophila]|nr:DnaJ-domain-containing protein [Atractiella rhizophila]